MNLYEINNQIRRILDNGFNGEIDPETGEILSEGEHDLETLEIMRQDKLEAIALYIKNTLALADEIRQEEKFPCRTQKSGRSQSRASQRLSCKRPCRPRREKV